MACWGVYSVGGCWDAWLRAKGDGGVRTAGVEPLECRACPKLQARNLEAGIKRNPERKP